MIELVAYRLINMAVGAVVAFGVMLMFGAWHAVQPEAPALGYLQVLWPLLILELCGQLLRKGVESDA